MRVMVVGAGGHLGAAVVEQMALRAEVTATTRDQLDVCDHSAVRALVARVEPHAVINCAAYTDVDRAEDEPVQALDVNAFAVRILAAAAASAGAAFVHYGTDFVFDGTATTAYTEDDPPNPRSTYACSKLLGEWFARDAPRHYVLRVESIFGVLPAGPGARRTSVDRIVDRIVAGEEVPVFADRTVTPSYHRDVATATWTLLEREAPAGLYHCVNSGQCTWEELALEAGHQLGMRPRIKAMRMADARLRAQRPLFCALSNAKLAAAGAEMPDWRNALARYLAARRAAAPRP